MKVTKALSSTTVDTLAAVQTAASTVNYCMKGAEQAAYAMARDMVLADAAKFKESCKEHDYDVEAAQKLVDDVLGPRPSRSTQD